MVKRRVKLLLGLKEESGAFNPCVGSILQMPRLLPLVSLSLPILCRPAVKTELQARGFLALHIISCFGSWKKWGCHQKQLHCESSQLTAWSKGIFLWSEGSWQCAFLSSVCLFIRLVMMLTSYTDLPFLIPWSPNLFGIILCTFRSLITSTLDSSEPSTEYCKYTQTIFFMAHLF